ncbi:hypothetical protein RJD38_14910 [Vibrio scophthalmi]|uniref:hypothetical protein n=1 Tax=Vibrio scophthalmi TaxID=45658 RepID=UPI00349F0F5A
MKINREILEQLFDCSIRIDHVFHMQLITACDSLPDSFWEVFEDNCADVFNALGLTEKLSQEYDLESKSELLDFLHDQRVGGVLLQFSMPVPRNFHFNGEGEFRSCSSGWSISHWSMAHAETLEETLRKAIAYQESYFEQCIDKAKQESINYE